MPHARFSLAQAARFSSATVTAGLLGRQKTGHLLFRDSTFPISAARHLFRSCCALDLELRPGTAMYKSGPRHQIFLFLHPDHLKTDRKSTRLNSSHTVISYAVFCLKKKNNRRPRRKRHERPHTLTGTPAGDLRPRS